MTYGSSHDIRNFQDLLKTQKCKVLNMMQLTVMKYQCYLWGVSHFLVEFNSKSFEACFFHGNVFIACLVITDILCLLYLLLPIAF